MNSTRNQHKWETCHWIGYKLGGNRQKWIPEIANKIAINFPRWFNIACFVCLNDTRNNVYSTSLCPVGIVVTWINMFVIVCLWLIGVCWGVYWIRHPLSWNSPVLTWPVSISTLYGVCGYITHHKKNTINLFVTSSLFPWVNYLSHRHTSMVPNAHITKWYLETEENTIYNCDPLTL